MSGSSESFHDRMHGAVTKSQAANAQIKALLLEASMLLAQSEASRERLIETIGELLSFINGEITYQQLTVIDPFTGCLSSEALGMVDKEAPGAPRKAKRRRN